MGVSRSGRFAAVTNFRGATEPRAAESRGFLVSRFLDNKEPAETYLKNIKANQYSGFNLLVCDGEELWSMSNRDGPPRRLEPGVYGLGNTLLDAPEADEPKKRFEAVAIPAVEPLFAMLSPSKIVNERYGTRCSTILIRGKTTHYAERSFAPGGEDQETVRYEF
jgi:uncharacterized protein with NRDE domain